MFCLDSCPPLKAEGAAESPLPPLRPGSPHGELVFALHRDQQVPEPSRPALATPPAPNSLFLLLIFTPSYPFNWSGASPQQRFQLTLLPARPPELSGDQPRSPGEKGA